MEKESKSLLSKKEKFDIFFGLVQVVLIVCTIAFAWNAFRQTDRIFEYQNRPNLILTENVFDEQNHLVMWNMGPGVAYNINVECHFADNGGNVGVDWIVDVIGSAIEIETKSKEEIFINTNHGTLGSSNHPDVLPVGFEYGFKTKPITSSVLKGLFVIINYKDNQGNPYYSFWDGYKWIHNTGILKNRIPEYQYLKSSNPPLQFYQYLNTYETQSKIDQWILFDRIIREAEFLKLNGFGDVPMQIKESTKLKNR